MQGRTVRAIFIITLALAMGAIVVPFLLFGFSKVEVWNTVAASLAVITALISAWATQTLFERQEEAQQPYPYPTLDAYSRTSLFQLRLTNMGGSTAYDICLSWNKPLLNMKGDQVRFSQGDSGVPLLLPNQSIAVLIDVSSNFLSKNKDADYSGVVEFKDNPRSNRIFRHDFYISAEMYRGLPLYTAEEQTTHNKLQKLPDAIDSVTTELSKLRNDLEKHESLGEQRKKLREFRRQARIIGLRLP